jgi:phosphoenolpyruvate carboxykinase (GTP)
MWPGFCENLRVLEWVLDRCNDKVNALRTPIGYVPYSFNIDMSGLHLPNGVLEKLLKVDKGEWLEELKGISKFFRDFKKDLPKELWGEQNALLERLKKDA